MISFAIPAYNEERLLPATLEALHAAGRSLGGGYEIAVADDASSDATADVARTGGARVVQVTHRQISATRNSGARAARGDVLMFVDADTTVSIDTVRAAADALRAGAAGGGAHVRFDGSVPRCDRERPPTRHARMRGKMAGGRPRKSPRRHEHVCQFLIVLPGTDPLVWRRILVPEAYSFWDLHVAIQDAMGWTDSHLHEFEVVDPRGQLERIGIPHDDLDEGRPCSAGWDVRIGTVFRYGMGPVRYRYDFGDDWEHTLEFEGLETGDGGAYPRCVAGAGACPPENVGGTPGYADFIQIIRNPRHPEHTESLEWVGGAFDAHAFDPAAVEFDDPQQRFRTAFDEP